jgi:hypothetical protein
MAEARRRSRVGVSGGASAVPSALTLASRWSRLGMVALDQAWRWTL